MYIILTILLVYILGILSIEYNYLLYVVILLLLFSFSQIKNKKNVFFVCILFLVLLFSVINHNYNSKSIIKQYVDDEVYLQVQVIDKINSESLKYNSFNTVVTNINGKELINKEKTIIYFEKNIDIKTNTIIEMKGKVTNTLSNKNKKLFNYDKYLRNKKVHAVIFNNSIEIDTIQKRYSKILFIKDKFKKYVESVFNSNLSKKNSAIILSILLGDKNYLSEDYLNNIRTIGLAHIFAISGLHIGILYGFLMKILKTLKLGKRKRWIATWMLLWIYGGLIGYPASILRALIMFTVLFGGDLLYRKYNSLNAISFAAFILLIINPFWIFDVGFQLSFCATFGIILFNKLIKKSINISNGLLNNLFLLIFLQIFLLPILAYNFNYIPVAGILYNIIFIPAFTVVLVISLFLLFLSPIKGVIIETILLVLDKYLYGLNYFVNLLSNFKMNGISIYSLNFLEIAIYFTLIFLIIYFINLKRKRMHLFVYLVFTMFYIFNIFIPNLNNDKLYINIIDVGQGFSSTVSYKNNNFIIDCGSRNNSIGEYTLVPYMIKNGLFNINGIFISHWHIDHYSGLGKLVDELKIDYIFTGYENEDIIYNNTMIILKEGSNIEINDNLSIKVIWPESNSNFENENNMSLVLLIEYFDKTILFTGDIEKEIENILLSNGISEIDILMVPHHGSKTSSTENFITTLNPKYAIFSYGQNNYGIPDSDVINRYKNNNSLILTTYENGEINFIIDKNYITYSTFDGKSNLSVSSCVQSIITNVILLIVTVYFCYYYNKSYKNNVRLNMYSSNNNYNKAPRGIL